MPLKPKVPKKPKGMSSRLLDVLRQYSPKGQVFSDPIPQTEPSKKHKKPYKKLPSEERWFKRPPKKQGA